MNLGDRMKLYEDAFRHYLPPRMPVILRVDGRSFHTFTKHFQKPWNISLRDAMVAAAEALMEDVQGSKFAYLQSDEISVLFTDYDTFETQAWFNKNIQKMVSCASATATVAFNKQLQSEKLATFDARVFVLPEEEICNYFIFRQQDCTRNSVSGLAQANFSHASLMNKSTSEMQEMLFTEKHINWNDCETWQKRGVSLYRKEKFKRDDARAGIVRSVIQIDFESPIFSQERNFIQTHLSKIEK